MAMISPQDLYRSPNALAPDYSRFRVGGASAADRAFAPGVARRRVRGPERAWHDAAELVDDKWERAFAKADGVRRGWARCSTTPARSRSGRAPTSWWCASSRHSRSRSARAWSPPTASSTRSAASSTASPRPASSCKVPASPSATRRNASPGGRRSHRRRARVVGAVSKRGDRFRARARSPTRARATAPRCWSTSTTI